MADTGADGDREKETPALPDAFVGYNPYAAACPTRRVLGIIANKWTSLVIVLLAQGTKRFQQMRREIDGITQKMLTQTLREGGIRVAPCGDRPSISRSWTETRREANLMREKGLFRAASSPDGQR